MKYERDPYSLSAWSAADEVTLARAITTAHRNNVIGTAGDDQLRGTAGKDRFQLQSGGADTVDGRGGDDTFIFGLAFDSGDTVNGGGGDDVVKLRGDGTPLKLLSDHLSSVESIKLYGGSFDLTLSDGFSELSVRSDGSPFSLNLDASELTSGRLSVFATRGDGTIIGGHSDDRIVGWLDSDILSGGAGHDKFVYTSSLDSSPESPDRITDFSSEDRIDLFTDAIVASYHIGQTAGHVGDILVTYDPQRNLTLLSIFTDSDSHSDMEIFLDGDLRSFAVHGLSHLVIGP